MTYKVEDIRNVALAGHGASGKTSLADALLFQAKAVDRKGNVDDESSVADFDEEEHKRKISIDAAALHFKHKGKHVHLFDTPGYPDFVGAALSAMNAVENVVIAISANSGIEVNTRRMFNEAGKRGLSRMIVINKLDGENIDFTQLMENIRGTFGQGCVLFNAPVNPGHDLSGIVSVLNPPDSVPEGCPVDVESARSELIEAVVEADEALMEKYLEEGEISEDDLQEALPKALAAGTVIPVFCTAVRKDIGVAEMLEGIAQYTVAPNSRTYKARKGDEDVELEADPSKPFVGRVVKLVNDKFVGNLSFIRVIAGEMKADQPLINLESGKSNRLSNLLVVQGSKHEPAEAAIPGDIIAVAKVDDLHIGDTVAHTNDAPILARTPYPTPMFGLAVEPKSRGDEQKISGSLAKMASEDPTFQTTRDSQTKELVINGVSQLHLDVIQARIKRRYDLEMLTKEPKIPYRETITMPGDARYRHKKQSGGSGQFAEVALRIYPLPRDITNEEELLEKFANKSKFEKMRMAHYDGAYNFAFIDTIVGGTIPNQFIPGVEKGAREMLDRGMLAGYRVQDVAVEVWEGKDHPVDSSEVAFKTATRIAFKNAFLAAGSVLLEPIVDMEVTIPTQYTGAILSDLNTKRARIENQEGLPGDLSVISAKAPLAEVMRYAAQLGSITQGQGSYTMEFSHYDQVPGNVQQQIVAKAKLADDEED